ncbi:protein-glutamate O-methyltransferase CheR [Corallococcus sp. BB11-1]|uniref:CheR family methyltransferase n=1 Tax=Corallococcus sp. BB11-1 TaxID=2996783 RepID=UPI0010E63856|nr:protein-glutamate O-methyltransferase CheR [Corallococcus sp. BB11-1]MCY1034843.1 protein-glutamate O-methyltransferase CheR [Corallococcus sp. BB11-1]RYZ17616.1 MAG: protein-glutamate O-methyltransferase CheR [Myxococcaceae bacterium]
MNAHGPESHALPPALSHSELMLFQHLVEAETGIHLSMAKNALVANRLSRRLRELGLGSFAAYHAYVTTRGNEAEKVRMLDSLCTHETSFFRESRHFDLLREHVLPEWAAQGAQGRRPRSLRVWSAGCSTGEEPYSLAMTLLEAFPRESGWNLELVATDLSTWAVQRAEEGLWSMERARTIPPHLLRKYMLRGVRSQDGLMMAGPEVRQPLRFARANLHVPATWPQGRFDIIFCRNVLIYFGAEARARVIQGLLERLPETGYFFLGHAESLIGITAAARSVSANVYTPRPGPAALSRE